MPQRIASLAEVTGTVAISDDAKAKAADVSCPAGSVSGNELKPPSAKP